MNAAVFDAAETGVVFHQHGAGEVVDHAALRAGDCASAASASASTSSRTSRRPRPASSPIRSASLPHVYGTHHIGASTDQAQDAIAAETVRIIASYKDTGKVPNVVNLAKKTPATHMLVVRHRDRPGVLAHVFEHCARATSTCRKPRT